MTDIRYPYLPEGRSLRYVSAEDFFMREARKVRDSLSTESKQPTGAVLVKDGTTIGRGANQSRIRNQKLLALHRKYCIRKLLGVQSGKHYWLCPGCATHKEHAEVGAVQDAKRAGFDTAGSDLYLFGHWWCCKPCWDAMIAAGVRGVFLLEGSERLFNKNHPANVIGR